ncbi:glycosyltransferase [Arcobacter sp. L]|uniref:glycosyltransferase n=1 Tax=Arcobacter sp. L TaxID=944547 RepID=UPI00022960D7|nr:glycosyltransferase [Arcobacter sp. L]BAK74167.1 glycosyltransferase [Arcobacter sp. L]
MKICQILAGNEDGGLEKHTIELSKQLKNRGIDITVIAHEDFRNDFLDVNFIPLDLSKGRNNLIILYKLYKIIKNNKFDIIHTQANKATYMISKLKKFYGGFKHVSTLHNFKNNLKSFDKSDFVISVSDKIASNLKNKNHKTIYNGIYFDKNEDLRVDLYEKYNIEKNKFIICSVARFTKVKRFELLIKAIKELFDVHLILVGDGNESSFLKSLAKDLAIENNITFTGSLENFEVKRIIFNSSLFVMCSDNEGFPYTFVETMFCNTPFISTPVSDLEKFLGKKYILKFDDYKNISQKIEFVKDNFQEVRNDFEKIFKLCENKLTVENMVDETIEVYKEVLR